ncbi:glycosyltransferase family 4 protein [Arthrobacter sp. NEB 688]|uniref:glycosyltransferase family 4 protein n=1 Tax=Arthrobacter sp. NEB 688 TaxID=904039 RepID=UPI00256FE1B8|nr:glycosyltransferase family 4 protein [Arthrobacter sp. NEB 688]
MVGQKGVPATFGGIEHHVEELGARLAEQGVEVTVYCRRSYAAQVPPEHRGMRLVVTPTVASKHLDAIVHSITSTVHAVLARADVVHYHAPGPGLAAPLARYLSPSRVVLTVHGLDHERAKWAGLARRVLGLAYWMSGHVPDAVVTVSRALAERYGHDFGRSATYIPNGVAQANPGEPLGRLASDLGLEPGRYVLFVGRMVPEKRPDLLVEAAAMLPEGVRMVLVGDSSFSDEYVADLRRAAAADDRVVLPGYLYGRELSAVYANAAVYVQPSDVEGLPLTLLEALSYGVPVVASDIPPHLEVLSGCTCGGHRTFPAGDATALGRQLAAVLGADGVDTGRVATDSAALLAPYDWDVAADQLHTLYRGLAGDRSDGGARGIPAGPDPVRTDVAAG